jgi:PqqD family protein of HPr-rel-A system
MANMTTNARPLARPDVSAYPLDDEIVIYTPADGQAFVLNPTAARIWELCDGTRTDAAMAREIAEAYGQDEARVLADVRELIAGLHAAGLVTCANLVADTPAGR